MMFDLFRYVLLMVTFVSTGAAMASETHSEMDGTGKPLAAKIEESQQARKGAPLPMVDARCKTEFHEVPVGGEACGVRFTQDRVVLLGGKEITKTMQRWKDEPADSQKLILFPFSPSGRYVLINGCSHECGPMFLVDQESYTTSHFRDGNYGPENWFGWPKDEAHVVLGIFNECPFMLFIARTKKFGQITGTPYAVYAKDSFTWVSPRRFHIQVAEWWDNSCDTIVPADLTKVTFELTEFGWEVVMIDEPSKAPIRLRNALIERQIVRGEVDVAVQTSGTDTVPSDERSSGELRFELRNDSLFTGKIHSEKLPFKSSFGSMEILVEEVAEFANEKLRLVDGNVLSGQFGIGRIEIATNRGTFQVNTEEIVSIVRGSSVHTQEIFGSKIIKLAPGQGLLTGRVIDNFGRSIPGATIRITGSSLSATTDDEGHYELAYVPGQMQVQIDREGYDSLQFSLALAESSNYPVEDKTLIKKPGQGRIYHWGVSDWSGLGWCEVRQTRTDNRDLQGGENRYAAHGTPLLIVSNEAPAFLNATGMEEPSYRHALSLYPVAGDGTIISVQRPAGLGGMMGAMGLTNQRAPEVVLTRFVIGNGRAVYQANLGPGVYAFVSADLSVPFPGRVTENSCFMFEIKKPDQIVNEYQDREHLAREMDEAVADWNSRMALINSNWSTEEWAGLRGTIEQIQRLKMLKLIHYPIFLDPISEAASVASRFAQEALHAKEWNNAQQWAERALELAPSKPDAWLAHAEAIYQEQSRLARDAYSIGQWDSAGVSAARALAARPDDEEMSVIVNRHEFEDLLIKANRLEKEGKLSEARIVMLEALNIRQQYPGFSLSHDRVREQDLYLIAILERLAINVAEQVLLEEVPQSKDLDEAVDLIIQAFGRGSVSKNLQSLYRRIAEVINTPGKYLGRRMKLVRTIQTVTSEDVRHLGGFRHLQPLSDDNTFLTVIEGEQVAREWKVNQPDYVRVLPYDMRIQHRNNTSGQFFFVYKGELYFHDGKENIKKVHGRKPNIIGGGPFSSPAYGPDQTLLGCSSGSMKGMDLYPSKEKNRERILQVINGEWIYTGILANGCALALSPTGQLLAVGMENTVEVYRVKTENGELRHEKYASLSSKGLSGRNTALLFSNDGSRLVVYDYKSAEVFESQGGLIVEIRNPGRLDFWTFSANLDAFIYFGRDEEDKSFRLRAQNIKRQSKIGNMELARAKELPKIIALFPSRNTVLVAFNDGLVDIYSPELPELSALIPQEDNSTEDRKEKGHHGSVDEAPQRNGQPRELEEERESHEFADIARPESQQSSRNVNVWLQEGDEKIKLGQFASARELFQKAVRAGSLEALLRVGRMYDPDTWTAETSPEVSLNWETAAYWYERAARKGNVEAQVNAGRVLCRHAPDSLNRGHGLRLLEKAVTAGAGSDAQRLLEECRQPRQ